jgi:Protein of unknown function (DUF3592)
MIGRAAKIYYREPMSTGTVPLALTALTLLVAIAFAIFGAISRHWPPAEGLVLQSSVVLWDSGDNGDAFVARVTYQYTVGGQSYLGSRISFGYKAGRHARDAAEALAYRFHEGTPVPIYYLPSRPSISVLIPGVPKPLLGWLFFLSLLLSLLLFMLVRGVA